MYSVQCVFQILYSILFNMRRRKQTFYIQIVYNYDYKQILFSATKIPNTWGDLPLFFPNLCVLTNTLKTQYARKICWARQIIISKLELYYLLINTEHCTPFMRWIFEYIFNIWRNNKIYMPKLTKFRTKLILGLSKMYFLGHSAMLAIIFQLENSRFGYVDSNSRVTENIFLFFFFVVLFIIRNCFYFLLSKQIIRSFAFECWNFSFESKQISICL